MPIYDDRTTLKTYFETGDVPTEQQFSALIEGLMHREDENAFVSTVLANGTITPPVNRLIIAIVIVTSVNQTISLGDSVGAKDHLEDIPMVTSKTVVYSMLRYDLGAKPMYFTNTNDLTVKIYSI